MIYLDDLVSAARAKVLVAGARTSFAGFAHDSRQVSPGECFVAVRGPHADGHDYLEDAVRQGAGAVLVEAQHLQACAEREPALLAHLEDAGAVVIAADDTRRALRDYVSYVLERWKPTVIGVTGSTGKTTTKEAIAEVLSQIGPTYRSWRNYNDLLGLPLALGALEPSHQYAVVEMACDHPGEIQALCAVARPTIGVVTNVSATHLQYFGSVGGLAAELNQLPRALPTAGYAVLNADDPTVRSMGSDTEATVRFFGVMPADPTEAGDLRRIVHVGVLPMAHSGKTCLALDLPDDSSGGRAGMQTIFAHLHGDHWAYAIMAALTVGGLLGVAQPEALDALQDLRPLPGRLNWLEGRHQLVLLDDSHNASPASVLAGLDSLAAIGRNRDPRAARIAVLGDMLRLGGEESEQHRTVGQHVAVAATHLVTVGQRAEMIAQEATRAGMACDCVVSTRTHDDAARAVLEMAAAHELAFADAGEPPRTHGGVVLIKGSEEMRMELVTRRLLAESERADDVLDRQSVAWKQFVMMRPDRPTWLEVDLGAIAHNTRQIADLVAPAADVLVSLKADAYGHGALAVARTVLRNGARWLGVATVSEARLLRQAGITAPILVFGYTAPWQAREAVHLALRLTVFSMEVAHAVARAAQDLQRSARVHVKVDTGMGRLGLRAEDPAAIVTFCQAVGQLPGLIVEGLFTHLATADGADQTYALRQLARFEQVIEALEQTGLTPSIIHAANSAATLALPQARYNLVRPGIAIYGLAPSSEVRLPGGFRPALSFRTQVVQVRELPGGEGISYGATFITAGPTRVATLPVGYADGFRRGPATWGEVLVRGQRAPLIGRVCMDQCMIDVTHIPEVRVGDEVTLIGRQGDDELTAEAVAARLGTIHYEVVAELLARVPRIS